jgi:hypothetical protein
VPDLFVGVCVFVCVDDCTSGSVAQNHILSIILLKTPALSGHEILTATKRKITKKNFPVDKRNKTGTKNGQKYSQC